MLPLNALPTVGMTQWSVFYAAGTFAAPQWQIWQKPAGCSMVYIFVLSSGGGGGRPPDGASTVGGGGGGSGGVVRVLIPAILLPDTLYIRPGVGGLGATTSNTAGGDGSASRVGMYPTSDLSNQIISIAGGGGGQASTTGGTAGQIMSVTFGSYSSLGLWYTIAGQAGFNGASAANSNGSDFTPFQAGIMTSAGAGGGNGTGRGGSINAGSSFSTLINGGSSTNSGNAGLQKGLPILQGLKTMPLLFTGGTGGGGHSTGTAGRGGDASYGGGGGGGGGCSGAGTSGNGGNGGDGFVIIGTF